MENRDETQLSGSFKKGAKTANGNVAVFAFFLFLSFVFWYLNSLGKDLETDIKYPVKYINSPENREFSDDIPSRLNLILKGPGYSILKLKVSGNTSPLEIDFSRIGAKPYQNSKSADYYIVTSSLVQDFNSQLKSECKIVSVKPDTLFFSFVQVLK